MSIRKIKSENQEVRWEVYVLTSGKGSKRLRRRFESKAQAEAFLEDYKSRKRDAKRVGFGARDFEETTFSEEARYWLEHQKMRFSPGHRTRSEGILREILPDFGHLTPNHLTPERLSRFQSEQLTLGWTPSTVNRKTDLITAVLNFSVRHRRLPFSPAAGFRKFADVREEMKFWERDEAEQFLRFASQKYPPASPDRWVYVAYLVALNTAVRAGEIWGLQPGDLTQEGDLLVIRRQWDLIVQAFRSPKGKKTRHVPCNEVLRDELRRLMEGKTYKPDQTLFQSSTGSPVNRNNFDDRVFQRDLKESGVKRIRFHDLRHTATTLMIAEGLDLKTVQEICGHKEIATTMRYVHLLGDAIKKAAKVFSVRPSQPPLRLITG